jgi:plastocyanin
VRKILILLGVLAIVAVGCGGGSSTTASGNGASESSPAGGSGNQPVPLPGQTNNKGTKSPTGNEIEVEMDDFYFNPTFIQGKPGQQLTLHLKNEGKNAHTFTSTALNVDKTLQPDQTMDVQVTLPQAGTTQFHCNFHQSQGMQGAFFFNTGDTVGGAGAGAGSGATTSSSSNNGGYNYPN